MLTAFLFDPFPLLAHLLTLQSKVICTTYTQKESFELEYPVYPELTFGFNPSSL